jgi:DNA-binding beta-propeller fold protein YncE
MVFTMTRHPLIRRGIGGPLATAALALALTVPSGDRYQAADIGDGRTFRGAPVGGQARLIDYQPYADADIGTCLMPGAVRRADVQSAASSAFRDPVRKIQDPYPSFAAIGVDVGADQVLVTDENLFQILSYDRRENTPAGAPASAPTRKLGGDNTNIEFQSGLYIDPQNGDIYSPNNDTVNLLVVFSRQQSGDVKPLRALRTPHGTFGIAVDEKRQEMYLTTQHSSGVVVFRKSADKDEAPLRLLQGAGTGLADPHGIAFDPVNDIFFVANYGGRHDVDPARRERRGTGLPNVGIVRDNWPSAWERAIPGSGEMRPPSISVHARDAKGNAAPLRVIAGPKTQLNWPTGMSLDAERQELYVANDMGPSILVFDAKASGDVAPKRVLKGPKTRLANPTDVKLDQKNGEMWVANFGGHTATVYPLGGQGDVAPLRVIRSAPDGEPSLMIGNPGAVAYDSKREELLVPN